MENISRRELDRACEILQNYVNTEESIQLAERIIKADMIPKLYQYAYVESMYQRLKDVADLKQLEEKTKYNFEYSLDLIKDVNNVKALDAIKALLEKAHDRQNEICDFADSTLPEHITGRCQDEEHIENCEERVQLTDKQQKEWSRINEKEGWNEAWEKFQDVINPDKQLLTLVLNFNEDETKVMKDDGYYICETCMKVLRENAEGGISCDLERVD